MARELVHRRHSLRRAREEDLSEEGRDLARRVGAMSGRFDRVVTSSLRRAEATAIAMGYAVDQLEPALASMPESFDREALVSFGDIARAVREVDAVREFAARQAELWRRQIVQVPDGGRLLMVSHQGLVEIGTIGAIGASAGEWGPLLAPLEGVRLQYDEGRWTRGSVIRLSPSSAP